MRESEIPNLIQLYNKCTLCTYLLIKPTNLCFQTCSELIKAGLKLSIESKRKMSGSDTDIGVKRMKREDSDDDYDSSHTTHTKSDGVRHF